MKTRGSILLVALMLSLLALAGCRSSMIYNVQDAPVVTAGEEEPSLKDIERAIIRAGSSLGWRMRPQEPGHIEGTLNIRTHMAKVDIVYDRDTYDILYNDSNNLDYDGENIHSNYNGWIQNLSRAIDNEFQLL